MMGNIILMDSSLKLFIFNSFFNLFWALFVLVFTVSSNLICHLFPDHPLPPNGPGGKSALTRELAVMLKGANLPTLKFKNVYQSPSEIGFFFFLLNDSTLKSTRLDFHALQQ